MFVIDGIGVSPGYAIGRAHLVDRQRVRTPRYHISPETVDEELARFAEALRLSEEQIADIKGKLQSAGDEHALILEAHQLMVRDEMLVDGVREVITEQRINAEWALRKVVRGIKQVFEHMDDEYFRERRSDVDFVGDRIMRNLLGSAHPSLSMVAPGAIIVAHDLSPADTAFLMRTAIMGFATDVGGKTSHTAIMARSLELPAVVGLERVTEMVGSGDTLIIDGGSGQLIVNPTEETLARYQRRQLDYSVTRAQVVAVRHDPAVTRDGASMHIAGNIELAGEAKGVIEEGAESVGLFRTEYLFMNRETLPTEEEQLAEYREVLEFAGDGGATIRTLDLGGDKFIEPLKLNREISPLMGLRAIRFCLREQGIFRTQLRAMLRASPHGRLRILLPMISAVEEVEETAALIEDCRRELLAEGYAVADDIPLGVMIELPAAVLIADRLARRAAFFSIGTNDLIQYTLALDRGNEHVAYLYRPLHPALLRMIELVVAAARDAKIGVSMCGEMAGDPLYVAVLMGLGLTELSMNTVSIPLVKSIVRTLELSACRRLVAEIRGHERIEEIEACVVERVSAMVDGRISPAIFLPTLPFPPRGAVKG